MAAFAAASLAAAPGGAALSPAASSGGAVVPGTASSGAAPSPAAPSVETHSDTILVESQTQMDCRVLFGQPCKKLPKHLCKNKHREH